MNGYVEAGYVVIIGSLGVYAASLLGRERSLRSRLGHVAPERAGEDENHEEADPGPDAGVTR